MTNHVSIADILRQGWEATKKNANSVLTLFVGLEALVFLLTYLLNMPILNILMIPVILFMQIAIFKSYQHPYAKLDVNEILSLKDSQLKPKLTKLFITYIIYIVLLILLLILLIIPGIIFMVYTYFFSYVVLDQGLSGLDALKKSRYLIKGHFWKTFVLLLISAVIGGVLSSIVTSIGGDNKLIAGLLMSIISGIISVYFGYVGVAYYYSLKK